MKRCQKQPKYLKMIFHRSSNGEWRSSGDVAAGDAESGAHHRDRGDTGNHQKRKYEDNETKTDGKEKKKKSEVESISSLKKLNEKLKEKVKKQGSGGQDGRGIFKPTREAEGLQTGERGP